MGVGGHFWDLLKPYARTEDFDFLRNKRVAVDLSFWIVQHETAIKSQALNPHLRLTFFRTISLFAKFGAFPVFVIDGTPSPLKSRARIGRFYRSSGIKVSSLPDVEDGVSVERNHTFTKCVKECVELLELFGMPILKAKGEAEALCAQLNREGYVDACITSDSDAFLFGAKCVIKCFRLNSKEPFECYYMSDIEDGLGLKRKHLIAISLLVGNDHDLSGVRGIGLDKALRFAQDYDEDQILIRLHEIGNGDTLLDQSGINFVDDYRHDSNEISPKTKCSHCSFCGHPGSRRAHFKFTCEYCLTSDGDGCLKKPEGFKCNCSSCDADRKEKELKKQDSWRINICTRIAAEPDFPNDEIIQMYLCDENCYINAKDGPSIIWGSPNTEFLVDYLAFHHLWKPSYVRQRMLPMLSTIFLREMAKNPVETLLYGQYEFDSIHREKMRYGQKFYVVKWKKGIRAAENVIYEVSREEPDIQEDELHDESLDLFDESETDAYEIQVGDGCFFLLTDENMELVHAAFPEKVERFLQEKELNELERRKSSSSRSEGTIEKSESPKSRSVQLNITEFYRSTKLQFQAKPEGMDSNTDHQDGRTSKEKRKVSSSRLPKSVRRRLLFK